MWVRILNFVLEKYPKAIEEWNYSDKKFGWSFRIKDKKRVIIYLLPRDQYFKVAFVFGQKATDNIRTSNICSQIRNELEQAAPYAEGRGIRIEVRNDLVLSDIQKLVDIKLAN